MLGVLYAALDAFTFALNNVAMRRGVVTGSVLQGMALTVPIGGLSFLVMTIAFGELGQLAMFPMAALSWLACQGIVHFVIGRYCNYKSNQLMGVNLTAPVVQLQVPFAMLLAVVTLHEEFTVLQAIGTALMLGGSFITQGNAGKSGKASALLPAGRPIPTVPSQEELTPEPKPKSTFQPRVLPGYIFGLAAAMCYGSSPLMARQAFLHAPSVSTAAGGLPRLYRGDAVLLADPAQARLRGRHQVHEARKRPLVPLLGRAGRRLPGFVYASLAVAPLMVVTPILQLSLVFRLFLSQLINRDHEVMNNAVLIGAFTAVLGSILVSLDTDELTGPWDCHHRWPTSCATASAATVPEGREGYFPHWKLKATGVIMPEERLPWGQTIISGMQHGVAMAGEGSAVPMQPLDRELARAAAILCC